VVRYWPSLGKRQKLKLDQEFAGYIQKANNAADRPLRAGGEHVRFALRMYFSASRIKIASCLTGIIHKQRSCGILPHNREERQDAAATNSVYE
jgi:hypothetical protein